MVNAMDWPSGDHVIAAGAFSTRVIWVVAPSASIQRTKIWFPFGSPSRVNAIRVPSGDQRGDDPSVRNRFRLPSAFMIQSDDFHSSFTLSTQRRPYTT